ncbi:MAG: hypothetical protein N2512_13180 [Armatimonadetes bacterium]|nr:hypothetical protein [Armatimonadota bacterium]
MWIRGGAADRDYDSGADYVLLAQLGIKHGLCYRRGVQRAEWVRRDVDKQAQAAVAADSVSLSNRRAGVAWGGPVIGICPGSVFKG